MLKLATVLVTLLLAAWGSTDDHWTMFKAAHKKSYSKDEEPYRRRAWETNLQKIKEHNILYSQGERSFFLGENKYADMTFEEFTMKMLGIPNDGKSPYVPGNVSSEFRRQKRLGVLPQTVDWVKKGVVTPVKDQGECNAGWAFSVTGAIEAVNAQTSKQLVSLSESNLIDCSQKYGTHGCNGGTPNQAYRYVMYNLGIDSEDSYPYNPMSTTCQFSRLNVSAMIGYFMEVPSGLEDILEWNVWLHGPLSVNVNVNENFQLYKGGVFDDPSCSSAMPTEHSHSMLLVGYGLVQPITGYWKVKNSWGTSWGEEGYIRMVSNKNNQCGIASMASIPFPFAPTP